MARWATALGSECSEPKPDEGEVVVGMLSDGHQIQVLHESNVSALRRPEVFLELVTRARVEDTATVRANDVGERGPANGGIGPVGGAGR